MWTESGQPDSNCLRSSQNPCITGWHGIFGRISPAACFLLPSNSRMPPLETVNDWAHGATVFSGCKSGSACASVTWLTCHECTNAIPLLPTLHPPDADGCRKALRSTMRLLVCSRISMLMILDGIKLETSGDFLWPPSASLEVMWSSIQKGAPMCFGVLCLGLGTRSAFKTDCRLS